MAAIAQWVKVKRFTLTGVAQGFAKSKTSAAKERRRSYMVAIAQRFERRSVEAEMRVQLPLATQQQKIHCIDGFFYTLIKRYYLKPFYMRVYKNA